MEDKMKLVSYNIRFGLGLDQRWRPDPPERSPGHGLTLDYCLVSPELGHKVKRAWVDSSAQGSDHRPYWVELDL